MKTEKFQMSGTIPDTLIHHSSVAARWGAWFDKEFEKHAARY